MNKGGRPRKYDSSVLKNIALNYLIYEKNGDASCFRERGIYSALVRYAQRSGYDCLSTDFSRCEDLKKWMLEESDLGKRESGEVDISQSGFLPLDIDYVSRPDLPHKELIKYLLERDDYYKTVQTQGAKAVEAWKQLEQQDAELHKLLLQEKKEKGAMNEAVDSLQKERNDLKKENSFYRRYIKKHVEPMLAEKILIENETITEFTDKEPATITLSEYKKQDVLNSGGEIISKIGAMISGKKED
ncbi:MAG: hypothetical protein LUE98_03315 [Tannerellaceae bacterium]|nr:hypothetical protein [Tannerellaceae bacterium]